MIHIFKIIVRSFWQIQSDPTGLKEIVKRQTFLQTIDARYNNECPPPTVIIIATFDQMNDQWRSSSLSLGFEFGSIGLLARLTEYLAVDVDLLLNLLFSLGMHSSSICCLARGGIQSHTSSTSVPPNIISIHPPWQLPSSIIFKFIFCYLQFVKVHSDRDFIGWTITMYLVLE